MKVLVVMYWLWFGVSVIVLGRRALRRISGRTTRPAGAATDASPGPALIESLAQRVHERAALAAAASAEAAAERHAHVQDDAAHGSLATEVASPAPEVAAPSLPMPVRSSVVGVRTTLADALAGIAMPSDLTPLTLIAGADMVRRAVFATTTATVERVDAEVGAELERLGYDLDRVGPHSSLARRGDDALAVRTHVIGPQPKKGPADAMYPTAPAGSVVLDVELT
jgi:hypothetical protein